MRTSTLLSLSAVLALVCSAASIGCGGPDVGAFDGSGAQKAAGDDDDDDDTTAKKATTKGTTTKDTDTATPTPATTTAVPATSVTSDQCFAHCVSPIPEAVALNTCTAACSTTDVTCLGNCFDSSGCGNNPQCSPAIDQCSSKCN